MWRSGPHHLVQVSTAKPPISAAGNTVRCATRPVNLGFSGPSRISRTFECTPSAPMTASAAGAGAVGEAQGDASAVAVDAEQLLVEARSAPRGTAENSAACRSPRCISR